MKEEKSGFILIELVVVIVLTIASFAMLAPAFSGEGRRENTAICANNLKQIGQAFEMYKQDNDGWFPANDTRPYGSGATTGWTWREAIWSHVRPGEDMPGAANVPGIFNCPSDRAEVNTDLQSSYNMNNHHWRNGGDFLDGIGYNVAGAQRNREHGDNLAGDIKRPAGAYGSYWTLDSWVEDPSGTLVVLDGRSRRYGWRYYDNPVRGPFDLLPPESSPEISPQGPKHDGKYNFLFADGSVRAYKLEDTVGTGSANPSERHALGMWTKTRGD